MANLEGILVYVLACLISTASGYTCSYVDSYARLHYLYCSSGACCGSYYNKYCCTYTSIGAIVGGVIGFIVLVAIISAITCCFCACCPGYRYRSSGSTVLVTTSPAPNYSSTANTAPYNVQPTPAPYTAKPTGPATGPPPSYQV